MWASSPAAGESPAHSARPQAALGLKMEEDWGVRLSTSEEKSGTAGPRREVRTMAGQAPTTEADQHWLRHRDRPGPALAKQE